MAKYIPIGDPVNESEREGIRQLRDDLPDHYTVIGNFDLQLPRRTNTLEYDAVVVGEWGVYAVEIRGWDGPIYGDIRRWELDWGRVQNPFIMIEAKAKALRDMLVRAISACFARAGSTISSWIMTASMSSARGRCSMRKSARMLWTP